MYISSMLFVLLTITVRFGTQVLILAGDPCGKLGKGDTDSVEKWRIVHRPYLTLAQASNLKHCFKGDCMWHISDVMNEASLSKPHLAVMMSKHIHGHGLSTDHLTLNAKYKH